MIFKVLFISFYVYDNLPACMYVYHMCAWCQSTESEKGVQFSETEVIAGCESPHRYCEPNSGPLEEYPVL